MNALIAKFPWLCGCCPVDSETENVSPREAEMRASEMSPCQLGSLAPAVPEVAPLLPRFLPINTLFD